MSSQETALEEVRVRLVKLERQNRRLKQMGAVALIAAASLFLMGQASSKKTVEANEFILRDDSSNVRARLSMNVPAGAAPGFPAGPQLVLFDEKGKERVKLMAVAGWDAGLMLYDAEGRNRGSFTESDAFDIGPVLMLLDKKGNLQTRLRGHEVLTGEIATVQVEAREFIMKDDSGNVRARLAMDRGPTATTDAGPQMVLLDASGKERVKLAAAGRDAGLIGLTLYDTEGRSRGSFLEIDPLDIGPILMLQDKNGNTGTSLNYGQVHVSDEEGFAASLGATELITPRTGETHKTSAASLVLFDKNKNVLWKAP